MTGIRKAYTKKDICKIIGCKKAGNCENIETYDFAPNIENIPLLIYLTGSGHDFNENGERADVAFECKYYEAE